MGEAESRSVHGPDPEVHKNHPQAKAEAAFPPPAQNPPGSILAMVVGPWHPLRCPPLRWHAEGDRAYYSRGSSPSGHYRVLYAACRFVT